MTLVFKFQPNLSIIFDGMGRSLIFGITLLLSIISIDLPAFSQTEKAAYFKLGANFNNQLNSKFSTEDLQAGSMMAGGIQIIGNTFGSGLEASYISRAAVWTFDSTTIYDHNKYVDIGVSLRAGKKFGNSRISLTGGLMLSFWMSGYRHMDSGNFEGSADISLPEARSDLDLGMYLGLEYTWKRVFLEIRTLQGLQDIANEDYDVQALYNQGISVGLGYRIPIE